MLFILSFLKPRNPVKLAFFGDREFDIHAYELADESADWLGLGGKVKPIIEHADFVAVGISRIAP